MLAVTETAVPLVKLNGEPEYDREVGTFTTANDITSVTEPAGFNASMV